MPAEQQNAQVYDKEHRLKAVFTPCRTQITGIISQPDPRHQPGSSRTQNTRTGQHACCQQQGIAGVQLDPAQKITRQQYHRCSVEQHCHRHAGQKREEPLLPDELHGHQPDANGNVLPDDVHAEEIIAAGYIEVDSQNRSRTLGEYGIINAQTYYNRCCRDYKTKVSAQCHSSFHQDPIPWLAIVQHTQKELQSRLWTLIQPPPGKIFAHRRKQLLTQRIATACPQPLQSPEFRQIGIKKICAHAPPRRTY